MRFLPISFNSLTVAACLVSLSGGTVSAAELIQVTQDNYNEVVPAGKETDAIFGDWVLRNRQVVAVIAQPVAGRKANMTVRGVAGMLIDFTRRFHGSDQLSCFYPAGGRYLFEDPQGVACEIDGQPVDLATAETLEGNAIRLSFTGQPVAQDGSLASVSYTCRDDQDWIDYRVELRNESDRAFKLPKEDALRCDGNLFTKGTNDALRVFYMNDRYFGQCYGFLLDEGTIQPSGGRSLMLRSSADDNQTVAAGERVAWSGKIHCSQGLPGVLSWARGLAEDKRLQAMELKLQSPQGPVQHANVEFLAGQQSLGTIQSDSDGMVRTELLAGDYKAVIQSIGRPSRVHEFTINQALHADTLSLPPASRVRAVITDGEGQPIAAKVQFIGIDDTPSPDFGPDSAVDAIRNVVYCSRGRFEQPIDPGRYQIIVSHGPEFDADFREMEVGAGQLVLLESQLPRTVDTTGWVSSDFHSHSSPSGDNVSAQRGRVLNLLAEHIEFAPCTEHNRIDTYEDDLLALNATDAMATCTGMELTGSPLPINHQNAFPLHRHEHTQDGGGPQTDADPVKQIERLAMWDETADKVVQSNHPNIPQILGDKDLNGVPDAGFRGMLGWMDVIEVHPPEGIFTPPPADIAAKDKGRNPIFFWMQLLNLGYRIPGVVNTDAHYNFHGSGWLRNYQRSSTDQPSQILISDMIHSAEDGHLVMTTAPFLEAEVRVREGDEKKAYISGEDVSLAGNGGTLWIRVQCANWFDVNRVQVFANGRPLGEMNFTRRTHPGKFRESAVRFELEVELPKFVEDTHLIVATIGEGLKLGPVMGPDRGNLPPVAVTNPIFIDVDGGRFEPNGDDLGLPFMLPELAD